MRSKKFVKRLVSDSEILGRELTKKLCEEHNWLFTEAAGDSTHYDCFIEASGINTIGEIKVRKEKYKYKSELYLEVKKYHNLKSASKHFGTGKILYINWILNDCFVFNVTDELIRKSRIEWVLANRVTASSREDKIYKPMYCLPKTEAKIFHIKDFDDFYKKVVTENNLKVLADY